jgi:hypothetical protein
MPKLATIKDRFTDREISNLWKRIGSVDRRVTQVETSTTVVQGGDTIINPTILRPARVGTFDFVEAWFEAAARPFTGDPEFPEVEPPPVGGTEIPLAVFVTTANFLVLNISIFILQGFTGGYTFQVGFSNEQAGPQSDPKNPPALALQRGAFVFNASLGNVGTVNQVAPFQAGYAVQAVIPVVSGVTGISAYYWDYFQHSPGGGTPTPIHHLIMRVAEIQAGPHQL